MSHRTRPVEILLVEDSSADIMLTREALEYSKVLNVLHVVQDGVDALDFLHRRGKYQNAPRPGLILLDLNLPRKSGREVLADIKADASLQKIPVVVLSTSNADEDVKAVYGLHANCYVVKPVNFDTFSQIVRSIHDFWFCVVELPCGEDA
ncbi:response regulator [Ruficoccus amylovorans]|uniref:Response regulator n=1 Tax=Ruficoccus amylovorans TaxID=1804625 RepID=A0A842HBE9_9BACT|nr:response regulator [Ruficoccus amylovorans]MBC2593600.1 response regulator [Ruficoccus amylovorans]